MSFSKDYLKLLNYKVCAVICYNRKIIISTVPVNITLILNEFMYSSIYFLAISCGM